MSANCFFFGIGRRSSVVIKTVHFSTFLPRKNFPGRSSCLAHHCADRAVHGADFWQAGLELFTLALSMVPGGAQQAGLRASIDRCRELLDPPATKVYFHCRPTSHHSLKCCFCDGMLRTIILSSCGGFDSLKKCCKCHQKYQFVPNLPSMCVLCVFSKLEKKLRCSLIADLPPIVSSSVFKAAPLVHS